MSERPKPRAGMKTVNLESTIELSADDVATVEEEEEEQETTLVIEARKAAEGKTRTLPFVEAAGRISPHSLPSAAAPAPRPNTGTIDLAQIAALGLMPSASTPAPAPAAEKPAWIPRPPEPAKPASALKPPAESPKLSPPVPVPVPAPSLSPAARAAEARGWKSVARPSPAVAEAPLPAEVSVLAASNAAADKAPSSRVSTASPAPSPSQAARIEIVYCDADLAARVRARHKGLLAGRKAPPGDEGLPPSKLEEIRARRDVGFALSAAEALDSAAVNAAFADASQDGVFVPPLVLVAGELTLPFDELAELEATVAAAAPFAKGDKALEDVIDEAREILKAPRTTGPSTIAGPLVARVAEAFARGKRKLPPNYLAEHVERLLLEQRPYQKRTLFGEPMIRALLAQGGGDTLPAYLPERIRDELPLFQRFGARLFAEARARADRYEAQPIALRVLALGRVL